MMNNKIVTRIANTSDMRDLARLNAQFNGGYESPECLANRLSDPFCVEQPLIAEINGHVAGFAALRIVPCVFYPHPHGELTELFVEEEYRRYGAGRELLVLAERMAKEKGVKELFVLTGLSNQLARMFYNSMGYQDNDLVLSKELQE